MREALAGKMLGHYRLRRLIGRGGMAEIYLAEDENLGREVAVKIVHRAMTDELSRFQREVGMLAQLEHEHILAVYDYGQDGPWHYLVMPYISHGTLADRLRTRGTLTPVEAGQLLAQVADALQYAHERGILHRDIKPSNILLRDDAYAYLADFGIARLLEQESGLTQTGTFVGTPEYMAPELFEESASQSSDLYALGIVLYNMLTGHLPFTGPNSLAVVEKQLHKQPVPPSQLNPAIPLAIEQVILIALEKDPRRRFKSARALKDAYFQALQAPVGLAAQPGGLTATGLYTDPTVAVQRTAFATPPRQPAAPIRSSRSSRALWLVIAGLLIALLGLGTTLLVMFGLGNRASSQTSRSNPVTVTAPVSTPTATATQPTVTCTVNDAANILDQNQVCQQAQSLLSYSLVVNTGSPSGGDAFHAPQTPSASSNTIVISIVVTQSHHKHNPQVQVTVTGGSAVPLTDEQYHRAVDAFQQALHGNDYTSATIAAIQSLQTSGA